MKFLILKDNFKNSLQIVERIAVKSINLPILESVLISTEKNLLTLITTDLEIAIKCWVLAKVEEKGTIVLPVKFISSYMGSLDVEKIHFSTEEQFLNIENQNFQAKIKIIDSDDFPPLPSFDEKNFLRINAAPFAEGLKRVVEMASSSQTKPEMSGVFFDIHPDFIKLVATDSFRLAEKTLFFEEKEKTNLSFILPQKTVRELINIFSDKKGKLNVYFSKNHIVFELLTEEIAQPRIQVFSRLIEGDYPAYQEIIPKKYETQLYVSKLPFLNQVKTAGLFCGKINEVKIKINPKKKTVEVFSQSAELGENKAVLQGKINGKEVEVSFNWRFLVDGISNIKSQEIILELNGEEGPAVLRPVGDQSYFYIIMPIKAT